MKTIILALISTTLLLANSTGTPVEAVKNAVTTTKEKVKSVVKNAATETGEKMEVKNSKRESILEAELAKKELERTKKAKQREEMLKKLDADLAVKAEERAHRVY